MKKYIKPNVRIVANIIYEQSLMAGSITRIFREMKTQDMVEIIRIPPLRLMPKRIRVLLLGMDGQNIHPGMIDA